MDRPILIDGLDVADCVRCAIQIHREEVKEDCGLNIELQFIDSCNQNFTVYDKKKLAL
jgi:hypothetical protein